MNHPPLPWDAIGPAEIALIGVPLDDGSSFLRGPAEAPRAIRAALHSAASNLWSETGVDLGRKGLWADLGDIRFTSPQHCRAEIESVVDRLLTKRLRPILLGGDHAVTYPAIRAFARHYRRLTVLQFDAHPDLYDRLNGRRFSHASPFARIMEERLIHRLVQVGVRSVTGHQRRQAQKFAVDMIEMRRLDLALLRSLESPLYVSVDLDALDPACAPGVSHQEPGGLSSRQVIDTIQCLDARIVGADIVELNPTRDTNGMTAVVAAKLLKELLGKCLIDSETDAGRSPRPTAP